MIKTLEISPYQLSQEDIEALDKLRPEHPIRIRLPKAAPMGLNLVSEGSLIPVESEENLKLRMPVAMTATMAAASVSDIPDNRREAKGHTEKGTTGVRANVDTFGYDTVFAIRVGKVNKALETALAKKQIPDTFNIAKGGLIPHKFSGSFDAWKINGGGSGDLVNMAIPFKNAVFKAGDYDIDFSGVSMIVQIKLTLLNSPQQPSNPKEGVKKHLVMDLSPSVVTYLRLEGIDKVKLPDDKDTRDQLLDVVGSGLRNWVVENAEKITYIFSKIQLNKDLSEKGFEWLTPTSTTYAYTDTIGDTSKENGVIGLLNLTKNKDGSRLAQQISPNSIPDGKDAAFLISRDMVLTQILLPALPHAFKGVSESDFEFNPKMHKIRAKKAMEGKKVKDDKGKEYTPSITSFEVTFISGGIQIDTKAEWTISWGITGHVITTTIYQFNLDEKTQQLTLKQDYILRSDHWCEISSGAIAIGAGLAIFATCVGAVLLVAGPGWGVVVALVVAAVICAGVTGAVYGIVKAIGEGNASHKAQANILINKAIALFKVVIKVMQFLVVFGITDHQYKTFTDEAKQDGNKPIQPIDLKPLMEQVIAPFKWNYNPHLQLDSVDLLECFRLSGFDRSN